MAIKIVYRRKFSYLAETHHLIIFILNHLLYKVNHLYIFSSRLFIYIKSDYYQWYICFVLMSRGVLALYKKTLNKSLGLIYLFLEHCNTFLQCSRNK